LNLLELILVVADLSELLLDSGRVLDRALHRGSRLLLGDHELLPALCTARLVRCGLLAPLLQLLLAL
jgi:hypothetical protein